MKTISKYIIPIVFLMLLSSCFKDDSDLGTKEISRITFSENLMDEYNVEKWDTFNLTPEFEQSIEGQELSYEWQVDYKIVSTERELAYEATELGEFPARLKVTNNDGSGFWEFTLKVNSPYQEGLLVMSKSAGKSMLSFKRIDKESEFSINAYSINNPNYPLGSNPTFIKQFDKMIYIGSSEPTKLMRIDERTFEATNILDFPGEIPAAAYTSEGILGVNFLGDGRIYDYDTRQNFFFELSMYAFSPDVNLSNKAGVVGTNYVYFDKTYGELLYVIDYSGVNVLDTYPNHELVEVLTIDGGTNILAVLLDNESGNTFLARYNIATLSRSSFYDASDTTIDKNGVFLARKNATNLYYSSENKVYAYNYLAGNFPTEAFVTISDNNAVIKDMLFDENEEKLYIAANSGAGELSGNVYCYDMSTRQLIWSEEGVAGDIVQMIYKK